MKNIVFFILLLLLPLSIWGQNTVLPCSPVNYSGANYLTKWQNNTAFPRPTLTVDGSQNLANFHQVTNSRNHYVQLRVNDLGSMTAKVLNKRFRIKAFVDIYFQTTPSLDTIKNVELTINHRPETGTTFTETDIYKVVVPGTSNGNIVYVNLKSVQMYKWINATDSVLMTAPTDAELTNVANNYLSWSLDAWSELERYTKLDQAVVFNASNVSPDNTDAVPLTSHILNLTWTPITGAQEYDIEWTFVDDYLADVNGNLTNKPSNQLYYDFNKNSTRIRVKASSTSYTIPIVYERGFLLVRVRGVGRNPANLSLPYYSTWSEPINSGLVSTFTQRYRIATVVHEADKLNWQIVSNYFEEGKRSDVISYFDGMMRPRQNGTKFYQTNTMTISEQLYDYEGRPSVQLMPSPLYDQDRLKFYPNLNGATPYNKANFEAYNASVCAIDPQPIVPSTVPDAVQGAAQYYSPTTAFGVTGVDGGYFPQAFGYAFSQVEYTKDNTGRVRRQGSPGRDHRLGSGHETKYYYGVPSQIELDRLFGNEVGDAVHYKKNMVFDANGQASVSYMDLKGNVIATALAGGSPAGLDTLNSRGISVVDSLLDFTTIDTFNHALIVQKTFLVPSPTNYSFTYSITPGKFNVSNCTSTSLCLDCIYDFNFKLTRDDRCRECPSAIVWDSTRTIGSLLNGLGNVDLESCTDTTVNITFGAKMLQPGSYTLTKTLKVSDAAFDSYMSELIKSYNTDRSGGCSVWATIKAQEEAKIDTLNCSILCPDCSDEMLLYVNQSGVVDTTKLDSLINCVHAASCEGNTPTVCEIAFQAMADDMALGGQYANYSVAYDTLSVPIFYYSDDPLSILNLAATNKFPNIVINGSASLPRTWQHPGLVYLDENNNPISVDINGQATPVNLLSLQEFVENFDPIWAKTLAQLHPEHCQWTWCSGTADTAYQHIRDLGITMTYAKANTAGLLNLPSLTSDPSVYNTTSRWNDLKTAFRKYYESPTIPNTYPMNNNQTWVFGTNLANQVNDAAFINTTLKRAAAITARFSLSPPNTPPCNIPNNDFLALNACIDGQAFGSSSVTIAVRNRQWEVFKVLYLSLKNEVLYKEGVSAAITDNCYNGCIGNDPFRFGQNGFTNDYNNQTAEPCHNLTADLYKTKRKVFPSINDIGIFNNEDINLYTVPNPLFYLGDGGFLTVVVSRLSNTYDCIQDNTFLDCLNFIDTLQTSSATSPYGPAITIIPPPAQTCAVCQETAGTQVPVFNSCAQYLRNVANQNALLRYQAFKDSLVSVTRNLYYAKCMKGIEQLYASYQDSLYHFTLYYYDQANNLVKTIPPNGISYALFSSGATATLNNIRKYRANNHYPKAIGNNSTPAHYPAHKFPTYYQYNSLNQVTYQWSPDAGATRMVYDEMRRLIGSQNANQTTTKFSYTLYDYLNRAVEVGECLAALPTSTSTTYAAHLALVAGGTKSQITRSRYDFTYNSTIAGYFGAAGQENLRGRIATVMYSPANGTSGGVPIFEQATHYSYDIHGNVKALIQDHTTFGRKRVDYEYELISGNVKSVWYQKGRWDQFIHYYAYDLDNKLKWVQTSRFPTAITAPNSGMREQEAQYFYTYHNTLRRVELGSLRVQGIDYAYTIHGWIKGVNSGALRYQHNDMGQDGKPGTGNAPVARDAFGYILGYYSKNGQNDYHPIGSNINAPTFDPTGYTVANAQPLYNGNIPQMITATREPGSMNFRSHRNAYKYDVLHRLKEQRAWEWNGTNFGITPHLGYFMSMTYDYAGNIMSMRRDGDASTVNMDNLSYKYDSAKPNRLTHIDDAYTTPTLPDDLEDQAPNNYTYDNIGNLIGDASEGGKTITWNVYNKITNVSMSSGTKTLAFGYDAAGNRVRKESTGSNTQWYVRDAQGNVLSVYRILRSGGTLQQNAVYLYGSSRIGELIINQDSAVAWNRHYYRVKGNRHYELTNHLGNVLSVVTDRKIAQDTTADATYNPQYFLPDIYSVQNYYAFGQDMPKWSTSALNDPKKYRFGFNGKEDDDEWAKQDYGFRIYDARVARFLSVDPLMGSYPWYTPYQFAGNMPIWAVDLDGLEPDFRGSSNGSVDVAADRGNGREYAWTWGNNTWNRGLESIAITAFMPKTKPAWRAFISEFGEEGFEEFKRKVYADKLSQQNTPLGRSLGSTSQAARDRIRADVEENGMSYLKDTWAVSQSGMYSINRAAAVSDDKDGLNLVSGVLAGVVTSWTVHLAGGGFGIKHSPRIVARSIAMTPALRVAYEAEVKALSSVCSEMRAAGNSPEQIARTLHGLRRGIGIKYKSLTPDKLLQQIYQRNLQKYGDELGPSIDYLRQQGKSWDEIINSAMRPGGKDLKF